MRTTAEQVAGIIPIPGDCDAQEATIQPYIAMACAVLDGVGSKCPAILTQSAATLELIERNLAAHYYAAMGGGQPGAGRVVKSDQVGDGVGRSWTAPAALKGYGIASSTFGRAALDIDCSGCLLDYDALRNAGKRKMQLVWIGTDC